MRKYVPLLHRAAHVRDSGRPNLVSAASDEVSTYNGEAVVSGESGVADFDRLHSREHDKSAMLWAFDLLELNGEDLRQLRLNERKSKLAKLLKASRHSGIALNEHLEGGERAFWHVCNLGCEGIVSKRRDNRYVSGRSKSWLKIKNPNAPGHAVSGSGSVAAASRGGLRGSGDRDPLRLELGATILEGPP